MFRKLKWIIRNLKRDIRKYDNWIIIGVGHIRFERCNIFECDNSIIKFLKGKWVAYSILKPSQRIYNDYSKLYSLAKLCDDYNNIIHDKECV